MMKFRSLLLGALMSAFFIGAASSQQAGQLGAGHVWGNAGASQARGTDTALSPLFDQAFSATQGKFLQRGASTWGPVSPGALTANNDTNVTVTLGGSSASALLAAASITMGWTGTLAAARLNSNVVQAFTNDTNVTASISAQNATLGWAGTLAIARGGTGSGTQQGALNNIMCSPTRAGDVSYWNGSNWVCFAGNNAGTKTLQEDASGNPSWGSVAGTGTVTQVNCAGLAITTSGTCPEPFNFENCSLAASVGSNLLTVALKDNTGSDPSASSPCRIAFRSAIATTGSWSLDSVTSALSISTNATGATLGSANNTAFRFWVVAFDNAGTVVLALYNATTTTSCKAIDETQVQSSTAISGTATSAQTYYTPNGTTLASKAVKILGYVEYNSTGLATAGTYATGPNFIQSLGPGMKRPCEPVQETAAQTTFAAASTSSASFQNTNVTKSITPYSAANLVEFEFQSSFSLSNSTDNCAIDVAVGSVEQGTSITVANPGSVAFGTNTALSGISYLNSTGSNAFTIREKCNGTTTISLPYSSGGAVLRLREIMG